MHPRVYREYERICGERNAGGAVLEVGARPEPSTLLTMKSLANATRKVGLDMRGAHTFEDFSILKGNANSMVQFEDGEFDVVLCNAVLEHDKFFWKTIAEIHRVTKPGGLIVIGAPGYARFGIEKLRGGLYRLPLVRRLRDFPVTNALFTATITTHVHSRPGRFGDYYRFSREAFEEVIFEGCTDIRIHSVMVPPRIIGSGIKT